MSTPTREITDTIDDVNEVVRSIVKERNELRAERTRLREVLSAISTYCQICPSTLLGPSTIARRIQSMADAALTDQKGRSE